MKRRVLLALFALAFFGNQFATSQEASAQDKSRKWLSLLVSQIDNGDLGWYRQLKPDRDHKEFCVYFCIWKTFSPPAVELYRLPAE